MSRAANQPDLFGPPAKEVDDPDRQVTYDDGTLPPECEIQRIRDRLLSTLAKVRAADALPWSDWTQSMLAEMNFHSMARWLPPPECKALRAEFSIEMRRLWHAAQDLHDQQVAAGAK